ncbi:MAG TPA: hypothetical protein VHL52_01155 [Acidimicrobiia bacterium]|nr:hypothetical protein [Acidimicrobiia bacterium]
MSEPIFYLDRSTVRQGALEEVSRRIEELVEFIREQEPQLIAYDFYLDEQGKHMTVMSVHPDCDSLRLHMEVGRSAFQKFADLIDLFSIEVYGRPSDEVLSLLEDKAAMLGEGGRVEVHERHAGFLRTQVHTS